MILHHGQWYRQMETQSCTRVADGLQGGLVPPGSKNVDYWRFGSASGVFKETIRPCSADLEMSSTAVRVNGNLVPMLGSQTSMLFIQDTKIILDPSGENVTEVMEKSRT